MAGKYFLFKYEVGDVVTMRKPHPCKSKEWEILRTGSDCRLKCLGCNREMIFSRTSLEKATAKVLRNGEAL